jgi:hypothetical protein
LGCHFADDPHSPYEFFRDDDSASAWATDGFSLHKLPTHNRRSPWKPLKTPSNITDRLTTPRRRLVNRYCGALADRLNAGPRRALAPDIRPVSNGTLARGVAEIGAVTRRTPAKTLKLIQGGKAPVAMLAGQPTALGRIDRHRQLPLEGAARQRPPVSPEAPHRRRPLAAGHSCSRMTITPSRNSRREQTPT